MNTAKEYGMLYAFEGGCQPNQDEYYNRLADYCRDLILQINTERMNNEQKTILMQYIKEAHDKMNEIRYQQEAA